MNDNKISREDKQFSYLLGIVKYIKNSYENLGRVIRYQDLAEHKEQVKDLLSVITNTLSKYPSWSSGKNLVANLLETRVKLSCYYEKVFIIDRDLPIRTAQRFNDEQEFFEAILDEILELVG